MPLSEAAKRYFAQSKRFKDKEIYIGIDWIVLTTPTLMAIRVLLIPVGLLLAFILPGNHVLPLSQIGSMASGVNVILGLTGGDIVRSLIIAPFTIVLAYYQAGWMAPAMTDAAIRAGFAIPEGAVLITSLFKGFNLTAGAIFAVANAIKAFFMGGL